MTTGIKPFNSLKNTPISTLGKLEDFYLAQPETCALTVVEKFEAFGGSFDRFINWMRYHTPLSEDIPDDDLIDEGLAFLVTAAHTQTAFNHEVLQAIGAVLDAQDTLRRPFNAKLDNFMRRINQIKDDWGSLEELDALAPISALDLPADKDAMQLYLKTVGTLQTAVEDCIDHDALEHFEVLLTLPSWPQKAHFLPAAFYTRDDRLAPKIRKRYFGVVEPQDEEVWARIINPLKNLGSEIRRSQYAFIAPSSVPEGFFDRYTDLIWHVVFSGIRSTAQLTSTSETPAPSQAQIDVAAAAMTFLMQHGGDPYAGQFSTLIEGGNIASIPRLKASLPQAARLRKCIAQLGTTVYIMTSSGTMLSSNPIGSAKAWAVIKALVNAFPAQLLASAVERDDHRVLLYKASADPIFIEGLTTDAAKASLLESDLGI
jgi:hypothetical protein